MNRDVVLHIPASAGLGVRSGYDAVWRSLSPVYGCCDKMKVGFEVSVEGGAEPVVLRLYVPRASMQLLAVALQDYLNEPARPQSAMCQPCRVQSANSSGRPQADGSMPEEGQGV